MIRGSSGLYDIAIGLAHQYPWSRLRRMAYIPVNLLDTIHRRPHDSGHVAGKSQVSHGNWQVRCRLETAQEDVLYEHQTIF